MMSWQSALIIVLIYVAMMLSITWLFKKKKETAGDFLVMNRKLGVFGGAFSMAACWIWAPAVFICSQKAYEQAGYGSGRFSSDIAAVLRVISLFPVDDRQQKKFRLQ